MTSALLELSISDDARDVISSLGEVDRRRVSALIERLRNGLEDEFVRRHSQPIDGLPGYFVFRTANWLILYHPGDSEVMISSIYREDVFQSFRAVQEAGG